jgi:SOS-response transcriptional repressor LexA
LGYPDILAKLRRESGLTQAEAAEYISRFSHKPYSYKMVSHWENGTSAPPVEQFLLLCELYGVKDIQATFRGARVEYRGMRNLNALGKSRAEEYVAMLSRNPLFSDFEVSAPSMGSVSSGRDDIASARSIKLYDIPVAAGTGIFLDSDSYEYLEADKTVPDESDFAVRVSGDSMKPRFVDGQIIFIKAQQTLEIGEIGIFGLNSDSYVKKLGYSELISLNSLYKPIKIREYDSFYIFGKVIG